jgi:hypothetical protein
MLNTGGFFAVWSTAVTDIRPDLTLKFFTLSRSVFVGLLWLTQQTSISFWACVTDFICVNYKWRVFRDVVTEFYTIT